ncbi:hypothetical protein LHGZ1_1867 [Laribacter hongkongensis]|uniref:Uncharacterized protein n=1 Tax=Laribacter hongkongensis TaxID=168471 RepID=A0A248LIX1_9NEIS|nr:hypothetical protein LHGZ1_1867 [Laribacter hongkongensis]
MPLITVCLWRLCSGHDLPREFGNGSSVHACFSRRATHGVWHRMTEDMQVQADQEESVIESEPANMPPEYKNAGDPSLAWRADNQNRCV